MSPDHRRRDQAADDLIAAARALGDDVESAAWSLLRAQPGTPDMESMRRRLVPAAMGLADGEAPVDPDSRIHGPAMLLLATAAKYQHPLAGGSLAVRGAVLSSEDRRRCRAILRGKA